MINTDTVLAEMNIALKLISSNLNDELYVKHASYFSNILLLEQKTTIMITIIKCKHKILLLHLRNAQLTILNLWIQNIFKKNNLTKLIACKKIFKLYYKLNQLINQNNQLLLHFVVLTVRDVQTCQILKMLLSLIMILDQHFFIQMP